MSVLQEITAQRRADVRGRTRELADLRARAADQPPARIFGAALRGDGLQLIAEIKRASPSAGPIADTDPAERARVYEGGGAAALSVLTEPRRFGGSLDDLVGARAACSLPVLRKDFLCEPFHLVEARAYGADAVLLIVSALERNELADLHALATELGLDVLVEVHVESEVGPALAAGARIVGINARNLATLEVDLSQIARVRPSIPAGITVVGESGIGSRADVEPLEGTVDAILVGETLMRADNPAATIAELLGR